jgi:hypothetical protein
MSFLRNHKVLKPFQNMLKEYKELDLETKYTVGGSLLGLLTSTQIVSISDCKDNPLASLICLGSIPVGACFGVITHSICGNIKNPTLYPKLLVGTIVTGYSFNKLHMLMKKN